MKTIQVLLLLFTLLCCSCDPSLYMTFENRSGQPASVEIMFDEVNTFWPKVDKKKADTLVIDLKAELCCLMEELNFGIGTWKMDGKIKELTAGITAIKITGSSTYLIEGSEAIEQFFTLGIAKNPSQIRIGIK